MQAGLLARKSLRQLREPELLANTVHEIRGIAAIDDAELRIEAEMRGVVSQQPVADRVEGARPTEALRDARCSPAGILVERLAGDLVRPTPHLRRRTPRECQHQNTRRIDAVEHQVSDTMRQSVGLAGAG